jgi:hypothetical protein
VFSSTLREINAALATWHIFLNLIRVDEGCNALDDAKMDRLKKG